MPGPYLGPNAYLFNPFDIQIQFLTQNFIHLSCYIFQTSYWYLVDLHKIIAIWGSGMVESLKKLGETWIYNRVMRWFRKLCESSALIHVGTTSSNKSWKKNAFSLWWKWSVTIALHKVCASTTEWLNGQPLNYEETGLLGFIVWHSSIFQSESKPTHIFLLHKLPLFSFYWEAWTCQIMRFGMSDCFPWTSWRKASFP